MPWKVVFYEDENGHSPVWSFIFFTHTGQRFVMLHAFLKKTPKTPRQEITIAERRMKELLEREAGK